MTDQVDFATARSSCADQGGSLVVLNTNDELIMLKEYRSTINNDPIWVFI